MIFVKFMIVCETPVPLVISIIVTLIFVVIALAVVIIAFIFFVLMICAFLYICFSFYALTFSVFHLGIIYTRFSEGSRLEKLLFLPLWIFSFFIKFRPNFDFELSNTCLKHSEWLCEKCFSKNGIVLTE